MQRRRDVTFNILGFPTIKSGDLWRRFGELGFLGVSIPEEDGGLGLGDLELCVVAEMAGRFLVRAPLASTLDGGAEALVRFGTPAQRLRWLPRISAGEAIGSFVDVALFNPPSIVEQGGRLTGQLPAVANGMTCDFLIVVYDEKAWLLEPSAVGVERAPIESIDPLQPFAKFSLTGVDAELLPQGSVLSSTPSLRDRMAVLLAFEQVGGADAVLAMAVAYAKERSAFCRKIGSFQAVKHLLANMYVSSTLARSNAYFAGWALADHDKSLAEPAAAARISATIAYRQSAADAIQVHGGIGFTWDLDCHFHYRRANQLAVVLGDPKVWENQLLVCLVAKRGAV